jgi:pimeloyl-ACP methyl ester carboxylesterase
VLALGGSFSIGEGVGSCMRHLAEQVQSEVVPDCGHWLAEEQPAWIAARLLAFLETSAATDRA